MSIEHGRLEAFLKSAFSMVSQPIRLETILRRAFMFEPDNIERGDAIYGIIEGIDVFACSEGGGVLYLTVSVKSIGGDDLECLEYIGTDGVWTAVLFSESDEEDAKDDPSLRIRGTLSLLNRYA